MPLLFCFVFHNTYFISLDDVINPSLKLVSAGFIHGLLGVRIILKEQDLVHLGAAWMESPKNGNFNCHSLSLDSMAKDQDCATRAIMKP